MHKRSAQVATWLELVEEEAEQTCEVIEADIDSHGWPIVT